jgi:putative addiction module component (TIGR02574 family)
MTNPAIDFSALTVNERMLLIDEIWASIAQDDPSVADPTAEDWAEIHRRVAELKLHPETAVTWEEVKENIFQSLRNPDLRYEIVISWREADDLFVAQVPELAGCTANGVTHGDALRNVERVILEWIETARAIGREVPIPRGRRPNASGANA